MSMSSIGLAVDHAEGRFPFTSYPTGWYRVAHSRDLPEGKLLSVSYFGRDLVVFRDADGQANVLDAYCPHLGAHLGVGGVVRGRSVVCPFHGWEFDGQGTCTNIPYCDKIPVRAKVDAFTVREVNGIVFVWWDDAGRRPSFDLPDVAGSELTGWKRHTTLEWRFRSHVQELVENAFDCAHFMPVHGLIETPTMEIVRNEGPFLEVFFDNRRRLMGVETKAEMQVKWSGMGLFHIINHTRSHDIHINILLTTTPIDEEQIEVKLDLYFERRFNRSPKAPLVKWFITKVIRSEFSRDIGIWERKTYRDPPGLCVEDGPIAKARSWCQQFYPAADRDAVGADENGMVAM